jgi:hypothetical protein
MGSWQAFARIGTNPGTKNRIIPDSSANGIRFYK